MREEGAGGLASEEKDMAVSPSFTAYNHLSVFAAGRSVPAPSSRAGVCLQQGLCRVIGLDPGRGGEDASGKQK